jgi:methyl-accepting chemotaxis protein
MSAPPTPPASSDPVTAEAIKKQMFSEIKNIVDNYLAEKYPDMFAETKKLFEESFTKFIEGKRKIFQTQLTDALANLKTELEKDLKVLEGDAQNKTAYILSRLDDWAKALGAPANVVKALEMLPNIEKPLNTIGEALDKAKQGNLTSKQVIAIIIALITIASTIFSMAMMILKG